MLVSCELKNTHAIQNKGTCMLYKVGMQDQSTNLYVCTYAMGVAKCSEIALGVLTSNYNNARSYP